MPEILYAFDIGTTGVKAGALTPSGQLIGTTYREYPVLYPGPQWVEQSVETMWEAQCEASQELVARFAIDPQDVAEHGDRDGQQPDRLARVPDHGRQ